LKHSHKLLENEKSQQESVLKKEIEEVGKAIQKLQLDLDSKRKQISEFEDR